MNKKGLINALKIESNGKEEGSRCCEAINVWMEPLNIESQVGWWFLFLLLQALPKSARYHLTNHKCSYIS